MNTGFSFKNHKISFIFALFSSLVVIFQASRFWYFSDYSWVLEISYRMVNGVAFYKDFVFTYPPGTFLIQGIITKLFGTTLYPQIVYCCIISFLTYLLTYRILFYFNNEKWLNLILSIPIAFTGGYGIVAFPNYDPDCTFFILISLFLILYCYHNTFPPVITFLGGIAAVFPSLIKQNTGFIFLIGVHILLITILIFGKNELKLRYYLFFLGGSLFAGALIFLIVDMTFGIGNYYYSIITIPGKMRLPKPMNFLSMYAGTEVLRGIFAWAIAILILKIFKKRNLAIKSIAVILILTPVYFIPLVRYLLYGKNYYSYFLVIWPLIIITCIILAAYAVFKNPKSPLFMRMFAFIILLIANASFLAQGIGGSAYGIWPFLVIMLVIIHYLAINSEMSYVNALKKLTVVNSVFLTFSVAGLIYTNNNFNHVAGFNNWEEIHHSRIPSLRGLSSTGDQVKNLDSLLILCEKDIPHDNQVITVPAEIPFYFATGREPRFPLYLFDWTLLIYKPEEIIEKVKSSNVRWMIIKTKLQAEWISNWANLNTLIPLLKKEFVLYKTIPGYEIYRRE
jgi:hypothetical protein